MQHDADMDPLRCNNVSRQHRHQSTMSTTTHARPWQHPASTLRRTLWTLQSDQHHLQWIPRLPAWGPSETVLLLQQYSEGSGTRSWTTAGTDHWTAQEQRSVSIQWSHLRLACASTGRQQVAIQINYYHTSGGIARQRAGAGLGDQQVVGSTPSQDTAEYGFWACYSNPSATVIKQYDW